VTSPLTVRRRQASTAVAAATHREITTRYLTTYRRVALTTTPAVLGPEHGLTLTLLVMWTRPAQRRLNIHFTYLQTQPSVINAVCVTLQIGKCAPVL